MTNLKSERWEQLHGVVTDKATEDTVATGVASLSAAEPASSLSAAEPSVEGDAAYQRAVKAAVDVDEGVAVLHNGTAERIYFEAWYSQPRPSLRNEHVAAERERRCLERREAFGAAYDDCEAAAEAAVAITTEHNKLKERGLTGGTSSGLAVNPTLYINVLPPGSLERHFGDKLPVDNKSNGNARFVMGPDGSLKADAPSQALIMELVLRAAMWAEANPDAMELRRLKARWERRFNGKKDQAECPSTLDELRAWANSNVVSLFALSLLHTRAHAHAHAHT